MSNAITSNTASADFGTTVRTFTVGKLEYVVDRFNSGAVYVTTISRGVSFCVNLDDESMGSFCVLSCRPKLQAGGKTRFYDTLAEAELKTPAFRGANLTELAQEFVSA